MFCRLLKAVDEDIISLDIPRSASGMPTVGPFRSSSSHLPALFQARCEAACFLLTGRRPDSLSIFPIESRCVLHDPCRDDAGIKESMRFKDAMRDHSVGDVAEAWMQLVATYSGPRPELTAAVLDVVRRYVNWIDIGLVANDRWAVTK